MKKTGTERDPPHSSLLLPSSQRPSDKESGMHVEGAVEFPSVGAAVAVSSAGVVVVGEGVGSSSASPSLSGGAVASLSPSSTKQAALGSRHEKPERTPQTYCVVLMQVHSQQSPPSYPDIVQKTARRVGDREIRRLGPRTFMFRLGLDNGWREAQSNQSARRAFELVGQGFAERLQILDVPTAHSNNSAGQLQRSVDSYTVVSGENTLRLARWFLLFTAGSFLLHILTHYPNTQSVSPHHVPVHKGQAAHPKPPTDRQRV